MAAAADTPATPRSLWSHTDQDPPLASDHDSDHANAVSKKPVWNAPSAPADAGEVIGAFDWPALGETPKPVSKSATGTAAGSTKGNGMKPASPNQKPARRGAAGASGSKVLPVTVQTPDVAVPAPHVSPRGHINNVHGGRGGGFQHQAHTHGGNDQNRGHGGGNRRGNGNNGSHHGNYGGRREPERGGYDWNNRNFRGREINMQAPPPPPLPVMRPFLRAPPPPPPQIAAPFIAAPPLQVRPFMPPMGYTEIPAPMYYVPPPATPEGLRAVPFVPQPPPPPPSFFPVIDPHRAALLKQIDYYFSQENLIKDTFLRERMDEEGWVSISLIAGFRRVQQLTHGITNNIEYILDTMRLSNIVEVQGEKIRRRLDWKHWLLPQASSSTPQSPAVPNVVPLATRFQTFTLDRGAINQNSQSIPFLPRSASATFENQLQAIGDHHELGNSAVSSSGASSDQQEYAKSLSRSGTF